ncbi:MAG: ATP-binding cassette domain-containing protein [Candidatus Dormibacteraceae bacterium]
MPPNQSESEPQAAAVEARGLIRRYGKVEAVKGIDLTVWKGEVFGLLGSNGAGKSTTLRMLCGLVVPTSGEARICGLDVWQESMAARRQLGYLDENPIVYPYLTGREFLNLVADLYGLEAGAGRAKRIERLLETLVIQEKADELISG